MHKDKNMKKITIEEYSSKWKRAFNDLKDVLLNEIEKYIISIEHVGSTSVEGLSAKPIIDIDIIVEDDDNLDAVISHLHKLGYIHLGDRGIKGREAFERINERVPFNHKNENWMDHHLYVCKEGNISLLNHLYFRDYLREHPEIAKEYGKLKRRLADECNDDIDLYVESKTSFIVEILKKTGFQIDEVESIVEQNKK
jgi:GrpB-like predicted nucleotidyltransferase (UPF0157 family)